MMHGLRRVALAALLAVSSILPFSGIASAAAPQSAWGENIGWISFDATDAPITVTNTRLTGFAWSMQYGWINLGPFKNADGVTNTSAGTLGGFAWLPAFGWMPMAGASIDGHGRIKGLAGVADSKAGRISFDCTYCGVATTWRPTARPTTTSLTAENPPSDPAQPTKAAPVYSGLKNQTGHDKDYFAGWLWIVIGLLLLSGLFLLLASQITRSRRRTDVQNSYPQS